MEPAAKGVGVTHHRGLLITVVAAVVLAAVGIGVLALAGSGADESAQDERSTPFLEEPSPSSTAPQLGRSDDAGYRDVQTSVPVEVTNNLAAPLDYTTVKIFCIRDEPAPGSIGPGETTRLDLVPALEGPVCKFRLTLALTSAGEGGPSVSGRLRLDSKVRQPLRIRVPEVSCEGALQCTADESGLKISVAER